LPLNRDQLKTEKTVNLQTVATSIWYRFFCDPTAPFSYC